MANKSGYFTDSTGNKLFGTTLGENVYLTDGTDLETKLNNMNSAMLKTIKLTGTTGEIAVDGSGQVSVPYTLPSGSTFITATVVETKSNSRFPMWIAGYNSTSVNVAYLNHRASSLSMDFEVVVFYV